MKYSKKYKSSSKRGGFRRGKKSRRSGRGKKLSTYRMSRGGAKL